VSWARCRWAVAVGDLALRRLARHRRLLRRQRQGQVGVGGRERPAVDERPVLSLHLDLGGPQRAGVHALEELHEPPVGRLDERVLERRRHDVVAGVGVLRGGDVRVDVVTVEQPQPAGQVLPQVPGVVGLDVVVEQAVEQEDRGGGLRR